MGKAPSAKADGALFDGTGARTQRRPEVTDFLYLVPIALGLGLAGLAAFMWALRSGQYDDLDGAAERILLDEDDRPAKGPEAERRP